ncbi:hypothetical protein [Nocardia puris]|uniref:Response regulatory domain-containing protein n=1 Tax=Nocardia puris TaxID=208602 RepID=A0A366DN08_9NOCA|nr:hypothetical protein [Nocardia puris]RBO91487.1 hypothetical protein DFR74_104189 [Nocardia puris]
MTRPVRVLVADDEPLVRVGIVGLLDTEERPAALGSGYARRLTRVRQSRPSVERPALS